MFEVAHHILDHMVINPELIVVLRVMWFGAVGNIKGIPISVVRPCFNALRIPPLRYSADCLHARPGPSPLTEVSSEAVQKERGEIPGTLRGG